MLRAWGFVEQTSLSVACLAVGLVGGQQAIEIALGTLRVAA